MKQTPRLMRGGLSGTIWCVTRYKDLGDNRFEALEKYDVTDNFHALTMELSPEDEEHTE